jgi:hypothetical protein
MTCIDPIFTQIFLSGLEVKEILHIHLPFGSHLCDHVQLWSSSSKKWISMSWRALGSVICEILIAQPNCWYIPSLVFTPKIMEYMMWDHLGTICSTELNYHTDLVRFYNVIIGMIRWSLEEWGLDVLMRYMKEGSLQVLRQDPQYQPRSKFSDCQIPSWKASLGLL